MPISRLRQRAQTERSQEALAGHGRAIASGQPGRPGTDDERNLVGDAAHSHGLRLAVSRAAAGSWRPIAFVSSVASRISIWANWPRRLPDTRAAIAARLSEATGRPSEARIGTPMAFMPGTILPSTKEKPRRRVSATLARSSLREWPG